MIFKFYKIISKIYFYLNFFNYVDCHVSATWQKLHSQQLPRERLACQVRHEVGRGTFFKQFFLQGCISKFFFLQGRKSKLAQITWTIIIFKPSFYRHNLQF